MNEELTLAVEEFRLMSPGRTWLIPVRFDGGDVPDWDLGAGRALDDLNYADLFGKDRMANAARLVITINRLMGEKRAGPAAALAAVDQDDRVSQEVQRVLRAAYDGVPSVYLDEFARDRLDLYQLPSLESTEKVLAIMDTSVAKLISRLWNPGREYYAMFTDRSFYYRGSYFKGTKYVSKLSVKYENLSNYSFSDTKYWTYPRSNGPRSGILVKTDGREFILRASGMPGSPGQLIKTLEMISKIF
jgi:hypothetical protein